MRPSDLSDLPSDPAEIKFFWKTFIKTFIKYIGAMLFIAWLFFTEHPDDGEEISRLSFVESLGMASFMIAIGLILYLSWKDTCNEWWRKYKQK